VIDFYCNRSYISLCKSLTKLSNLDSEGEMNQIVRRLGMVFSAGALGGLVNSLAVWFFGAKGITASLGVNMAPHLTASWLYPRIVWGGIFGALFLVPVLRGSIFWRGLLWSLGPTAVQLLVVFPTKAGKGMMGFELGTLTPVFVLFFNFVWGFFAALWLTATRD